jgi:hypothetical protein
MKQEQLQQIIDRLESNPYTAITVKGLVMGNESKIICNASNQVLTEKYGSATNFFESL